MSQNSTLEDTELMVHVRTAVELRLRYIRTWIISNPKGRQNTYSLSEEYLLSKDLPWASH